MTQPDESRPLSGDPALSRLYQASQDSQPASALDAAILAAARTAVAPRVAKNKAWWQRLTLPLSAAATLLLTVMLSLTMQHNPPEVAEVAVPRPAPVAPVVSPAGEGRSEADAAAKEAEVPPTVSASAPATASRSAIQAEKKRVPAAPAAAVRDTGVAPAMEGRVGESVPAAKAEGSERIDPAVADRARGSLAAPAAARATAGVPQLESAAKRVQPSIEASWLEEIRSLRRQGKHEEAAHRLAEFRVAYPDYPLPDDLK